MATLVDSLPHTRLAVKTAATLMQPLLREIAAPSLVLKTKVHAAEQDLSTKLAAHSKKKATTTHYLVATQASVVQNDPEMDAISALHAKINALKMQVCSRFFPPSFE